MSGNVVDDVVIRILKGKIRGDVPELNPDTKLEKLGIISLDFLDAIFELEEELDISIEYSDAISEFLTIGDLIDEIKKTQKVDI